MDKQMYLNGLSSKTLLRQRFENGACRQWHEHPESGRIVVLDKWAVEDGECIAHEMEVVDVLPKQKNLATCIRALEYTYQRLQQI